MELVLFFLGISSGVLCVIFGLYEKLIESFLGFFQDIKKNALFLFSIGIGAFFGIFLLGKLLIFLFTNYIIPTSYLFIGLILGCIPSLIKQIHSKHKIDLICILCLLLTFCASLYLVAIEKHSTFSIAYNQSFFSLFYSGLLMSTGIVIPGISSTVILMLLGIYETYLYAISNLDLAILIPLGCGILIGGIFFLKLIQILLKHFKPYTFFGIIGFVLGSIFVLFPGFSLDLTGLLSILLLIIGLLLSLFFERFSN